MAQSEHNADQHTPWNSGKLVGQKSPLKAQEVWELRVRLRMAGKTRDFALFNLALDSKLRGRAPMADGSASRKTHCAKRRASAQ